MQQFTWKLKKSENVSQSCGLDPTITKVGVGLGLAELQNTPGEDKQMKTTY